MPSQVVNRIGDGAESGTSWVVIGDQVQNQMSLCTGTDLKRQVSSELLTCLPFKGTQACGILRVPRTNPGSLTHLLVGGVSVFYLSLSSYPPVFQNINLFIAAH